MRFLSWITYLQGQFNDASAFATLKAALEARETDQENQWLASQGHPHSGRLGGRSSKSNGGAAHSPTIRKRSGSSGTRQDQTEAGPDSSEPELAVPTLAVSFWHIRTFYFAVPPFLYPNICRCLQEVRVLGLVLWRVSLTLSLSAPWSTQRMQILAQMSDHVMFLCMRAHVYWLDLLHMLDALGCGCNGNAFHLRG